MGEIWIECMSKKAEARIINKNPVTAEKILTSLPLEGNALKWGDEIYFYIDVEIEEENSQEEVEIGDIAYWPEGKAICIFLGLTPISKDKPKAISPVNVFAKLDEKIGIKEGEKVRIFKDS